MINKPPLKGLNIKIPIKGRGFINQGSTLGCRLWHSAKLKFGVLGPWV